MSKKTFSFTIVALFVAALAVSSPVRAEDEPGLGQRIKDGVVALFDHFVHRASDRKDSGDESVAAEKAELRRRRVCSFTDKLAGTPGEFLDDWNAALTGCMTGKQAKEEDAELRAIARSEAKTARSDADAAKRASDAALGEASTASNEVKTAKVEGDAAQAEARTAANEAATATNQGDAAKAQADAAQAQADASRATSDAAKAGADLAKAQADARTALTTADKASSSAATAVSDGLEFGPNDARAAAVAARNESSGAAREADWAARLAQTTAPAAQAASSSADGAKSSADGAKAAADAAKAKADFVAAREVAIGWARSHGGNAWYTECLGFVNAAYKSAGYSIPELDAGCAMDAYDSFPSSQLRHDTNPPRGAVVFYNYTGWAYSYTEGRWVYGNWGHATISLGDGTVIMSPQSPNGGSVVMPVVNSAYGSPLGYYAPGP